MEEEGGTNESITSRITNRYLNTSVSLIWTVKSFAHHVVYTMCARPFDDTSVKEDNFSIFCDHCLLIFWLFFIRIQFEMLFNLTSNTFSSEILYMKNTLLLAFIAWILLYLIFLHMYCHIWLIHRRRTKYFWAKYLKSIKCGFECHSW